MAKSKLKLEKERVLECMTAVDPNSETYTTMADNLIRLSQSENKREIDPNTVLAVGANIAGILAVLSYEHLNVIVSKAFGLIVKTRI